MNIEQLPGSKVETICPVIGSFVYTIGTSKIYESAEQREIEVGDMVLHILNSRNDDKSQRRLFSLLDALIREVVPIGLRLHDDEIRAIMVEALQPITGNPTAVIAHRALARCNSTAFAYGAAVCAVTAGIAVDRLALAASYAGMGFEQCAYAYDVRTVDPEAADSARLKIRSLVFVAVQRMLQV